MGKATYTVTVTNNSNGVSVDYETETPMTLLVPEVAAHLSVHYLSIRQQ
ncbi:DUF1869 domain-containing protein [Escherichia coli]|nr:DUF1869 domain-containing protein [Escherichia coli]